jgi:NAD(P)-dependent dehydrogenase (short-subunit alcohol dehydrogenase family)
VNRSVVVTGAAGGIGRAVVELFAEKGWRVAAVDRAAQVDLPDGATAYQADVSWPDEVDRVARAVAGTLDALVNNAGIGLNKSLAETQPEEWDTVMAANARSMFLVTRACLPALKQARGAVVNMASVHALATVRNAGAYAASKGAVLALTRAMALEFGGDGIRVNAVLPGAVDTQMLRRGLSRQDPPALLEADQLAQLADRIALGRIGKPAEIAQAVFFLCDSDASGYVTGHGLVVDGGATARLGSE